VQWYRTGLSSDDLELLGTLGSVLPALEELRLIEPAASPDGVPRLAEKLGAGALPAVTYLNLDNTYVGEAGASALAAALGRGALPRLTTLDLGTTALGDAGLVALAPALRRLPALELLSLWGNPFGDEGLAALVAPPPAAGAPPTTTGGLAKLKAVSRPCQRDDELQVSTTVEENHRRCISFWPCRSSGTFAQSIASNLAKPQPAPVKSWIDRTSCSTWPTAAGLKWALGPGAVRGTVR
jgi:hypothetical protein